MSVRSEKNARLRGWAGLFVGCYCMADELSEMFERNMKLVDDEKRHVFVGKMREYHSKFKDFRDSMMSYEESVQYQNELFLLCVVDKCDYWIYSPQFCKSVGVMISKLFKTKITHTSVRSCAGFCNATVYFDKHGNRWLMTFEYRESAPDQVFVGMRFPRSHSCVKVVHSYDDKTVSDPQFDGSFLVADVSADGWDTD